MKTKTKRTPRKNRPPTDIYTAVTEQIIARLKEGVVPWRRPWDNRVGAPRNLKSGNPYSGVNILLLGSLGFPSRYWMTFLQAREAGGSVKKGAKGSMILKYGISGRSAGEEDDDEVRGKRFLRLYHVFNLTQIDGVDTPDEQERAPTVSCPLDGADRIAVSMPEPPEIVEGESLRAAYSLSSDRVMMPPRSRFVSTERFYLALFHELVHSTGHPERLNRSSLTDAKDWGDATYSFEELIAEIGASMLGAEVGIVRDDHGASAAYIDSWLEVLKSQDHRKWVISASRLARQAVERIRPTENAEPSEPAPASADSPIQPVSTS